MDVDATHYDRIKRRCVSKSSSSRSVSERTTASRRLCTTSSAMPPMRARAACVCCARGRRASCRVPAVACASSRRMLSFMLLACSRTLCSARACCGRATHAPRFYASELFSACSRYLVTLACFITLVMNESCLCVTRSFRLSQNYDLGMISSLHLFDVTPRVTPWCNAWCNAVTP